MNKTFFQAFYPEGVYVVPEKKIESAKVNAAPKQEIIEDEVVPQEVLKEVEVIKEEKITFIGQNNKKILILIDDDSTPTINDPDKEFLGKILVAIKLSYNDVALVNCATYPSLTIESLENSVSFTRALLFGDTIKGILGDIKVPKYKLAESNNIELLYCDSLLEIQDDKNKKVMLWEELKKMMAK